MNWVGGVRDRVHRNTQTFMKQKEHFERKRVAKLKQKSAKPGKGISRDILNLDCVSRTIRNPFDEESEGTEFAPGPSKLSKAGNTSARKELRNNSLTNQIFSKHSYRLSQRNGRKKGSSDLLHQKNKENKRCLFSNRKNITTGISIFQSTPLSFKEASSQFAYRQPLNTTVSGNLAANYRSFNLPSPIPSQESFLPESAPIHPITLVSDLEPPPTEQPGIANTSQYNASQLRNNYFPNVAEDVHYNDLLHGVTSCSYKPRRAVNTQNLQDPDQFSQYDMKNHSVMPSNFSTQQIPASAPPLLPTHLHSAQDGSQSYSLFHTHHTPSLQFPCDTMQVKQEIEDENIFVNHSSLMSSSYRGGTSYEPSSDSSPAHCSSLFTSSKSSTCRQHPSPVSSPDRDPPKLFGSFLNQNSPLKVSDKAVQTNFVVETTDVSTSPIVWPRSDQEVQVSKTEDNDLGL